MIMSVSTLTILSGAATPVRVVNGCMGRTFEAREGAHATLSSKAEPRSPAPRRRSRLRRGGPALVRRRLHVGVREPEVVADLVHEDVGDEVPEGLLVRGPVVEERPAVEPDHVRELP